MRKAKRGGRGRINRFYAFHERGSVLIITICFTLVFFIHSRYSAPSSYHHTVTGSLAGRPFVFVIRAGWRCQQKRYYPEKTYFF
jgi:hypothetical protein